MESTGYTQEQMAEALMASASTVRRWEAGAHTRAAISLPQLSYLTASSVSPHEARPMAESARVVAGQEAPPVVRALLADHLTWVCARTGDDSGADRAMGTALDAHDQRDSWDGEEPTAPYWIIRDESLMKAGRCWAELRRPDRAGPVLEQRTVPYADSQARSRARYSAWLASAYLDAGEVGAAVSSARRAVGLSQRTSSPAPMAIYGVCSPASPRTGATPTCAICSNARSSGEGSPALR